MFSRYLEISESGNAIKYDNIILDVFFLKLFCKLNSLAFQVLYKHIPRFWNSGLLTNLAVPLNISAAF